MLIISYILSLIMATPQGSSLSLGEGRGEASGISVENLQTEVVGEDFHLNFTLAAHNLNINCDGYRILEFAVENAENRLVLPTVVYSGTIRYRYERRREELSGIYPMEPYYIYKGIKKDESYELDYALSLPYYSWMEHASVTYREYTHDCSGNNLTAEGVLLADLIPVPVYVEPEIWKPNPAHYQSLVSFLVPEVEEVKARASMISLNIGFPVNVVEVRSSFGNNEKELMRADSLVESLQDNDLLTINGVSICGYASPEGKYAVNERLAKGRSLNFKQYLVDKYPDNAYIRNARTSWVPEDWERFGKMVEGSDIVAKQEVLAIVNDNNIAPDTKDHMLQQITWWSSNYKIILKEMFPKLRRIELKTDYIIQKLDDNKARELLYTHPSMLSLDEIYRVARYYEPGTKQYREVYEIAARQYPNDIIANHNAAAALLQQGDAQGAWTYLEKTKGANASLINYGAYYYITEDLDKAIEYFTKAKEAGIGQAGANLQLIGAE